MRHISKYLTRFTIQNIIFIYKNPSTPRNRIYSLFCTSKTTPPDICINTSFLSENRHTLKLEQLQQYHEKISDSLRYMVGFLQNNRVKLDKFTKPTKLYCQILIKDLNDLIQQIDKKLLIANQPVHFHQQMILFFDSILQYIQKLHLEDQHIKLQNKFLIVLQLIIKLKNLFIFFDFTKPKHSIQIYNLPNVQYIKLKDSQNLKQQYQGLQKMLHFITALTSYLQTSTDTNNIIQKFAKGYHFASQNKIVLRSLEAHYKQNLKLITKSLQISEWPFFKPLAELMRPSIKTNMLIYVPFDKNEKEWDVFKPSEKAIPVRVLYNHDFKQQSQRELIKENVMFHIHGGGFVALSSHSTQIYSRAWAIQTNMVLFSIDYRLAPQFPFPIGLQDCQTVYEYILDRIQIIFKIKPKNIYIGGDSGGGNLTCGLTALILKNKLRVPKGLFLAYPFLDGSAHFYGSRKYLIQDPLLWPSFGNLALNSYVKSHEITNPLISPLFLTDSFVGGSQGQSFPKNWPVTYIHVGEKDALRDQSLLLMEKMNNQDIKCKCFVMQGLSHGYLCTVGLITSSIQAVNHSAKMLKQLISTDSKES